MNSPQELTRQIQELSGKLRFYAPPNIAQINHDLQRAVVKATIDPALRGEVHHFNQLLEQAQAAVEQHEQDQRTLHILQQQLEEAEHEQKQQRIALANQAIQAARSDFNHCAMQLANAYRKLLDQSQRNQHIPGASHQVDEDFDIKQLNSSFSSFSTGATMKMGRMHWEAK